MTVWKPDYGGLRPRDWRGHYRSVQEAVQDDERSAGTKRFGRMARGSDSLAEAPHKCEKELPPTTSTGNASIVSVALYCVHSAHHDVLSHLVNAWRMAVPSSPALG